jgi:hypothetical protein
MLLFADVCQYWRSLFLSPSVEIGWSKGNHNEQYSRENPSGARTARLEQIVGIKLRFFGPFLLYTTSKRAMHYSTITLYNQIFN